MLFHCNLVCELCFHNFLLIFTFLMLQRALSNMRIPSYIGEVTCTAVDPGTLPPRILAMRVLPSDMNEVWSLEVDIEYLGGILLDIETRLELRELELEEEESRLNGNSDGEVTPDLLEGIEYLGEQLKLPEETIDEGHHGRCVRMNCYLILHPVLLNLLLDVVL